MKPEGMTRAEILAELRKLYLRWCVSTFGHPQARALEFQKDMDLWRQAQLEKQLDPPLTAEEKAEVTA